MSFQNILRHILWRKNVNIRKENGLELAYEFKIYGDSVVLLKQYLPDSYQWQWFKPHRFAAELGINPEDIIFIFQEKASREEYQLGELDFQNGKLEHIHWHSITAEQVERLKVRFSCPVCGAHYLRQLWRCKICDTPNRLLSMGRGP